MFHAKVWLKGIFTQSKISLTHALAWQAILKEGIRAKKAVQAVPKLKEKENNSKNSPLGLGAKKNKKWTLIIPYLYSSFR